VGIGEVGKCGISDNWVIFRSRGSWIRGIFL